MLRLLDTMLYETLRHAALRHAALETQTAKGAPLMQPGYGTREDEANKKPAECAGDDE